MKGYLIASVVLWPSLALAQQGSWESAFFFGDQTHSPIFPIHLIHVYDGVTGKVLALTLEEDLNDPNCLSGRATLWTPPVGGLAAPGLFEDARVCRTDLFCAGHSALKDGRVLHAGGNYQAQNGMATLQADMFFPARPIGSKWDFPTHPQDMHYRRFYPTCTTLAGGTVLVSSGTVDNFSYPRVWASTPELYDPDADTWTPLFTADRVQAEYPWMFLLPDGNFLDAGHTNPFDPYVQNHSFILYSSNWTWGTTPVADPAWPNPLVFRPGEHGSAAMFEPGKIVKCGGQDYFRSPNIDQYRGVAATFVLDMSDPNPGNQQAWISAQDMNIARLNHTLVILPDGKVLAVGGSTKVEDSYCNPPMVPCAAPVLEAEIFDPASGKWTLQPPMDASNPRMYHSAAMLLPDGRVVCAGGNGVRTAQIFDPEYIQHFNLRPSITSSPLYMQYGGQYNIQYLPNDGKKVSKVCLMRLAAVTHAFDQDQRRVPLTITVPGTGASPDQITVQAPANGNIAPPGYYMLFVLSEYSLNEFAPCRLAAYVKVGP